MVDEMVNEAQVVEHRVREASEYVADARAYADSGYDRGSTEGHVEPDVALAYCDLDELVEDVNSLDLEGIVGMFVRRRVRNAEDGKVPDGKSGYVTRQLQRYEQIRETAEQYLETLEDDMDALQGYVEDRPDQPDDTAEDWTVDTLMDEYGEEYVDRFADRDAFEDYIEDHLVDGE